MPAAVNFKRRTSSTCGGVGTTPARGCDPRWSTLIASDFTSSLTAPPASGAFLISQGVRRNQPLCEFVPDLCQRIADLAGLDDLVRRKNSNLRAINGGRGTDSVPGHQLHSTLFAVRLNTDAPHYLVHRTPVALDGRQNQLANVLGKRHLCARDISGLHCLPESPDRLDDLVADALYGHIQLHGPVDRDGFAQPLDLALQLA